MTPPKIHPLVISRQKSMRANAERLGDSQKPVRTNVAIGCLIVVANKIALTMKTNVGHQATPTLVARGITSPRRWPPQSAFAETDL